MTLATKLFGVTAICALCCALPLTTLLTAGLFEFGAMAWGIPGGIASILVVAVLTIMLTRKSASKDTSCTPVGCGCLPPQSNDAAPPIACTLSPLDYAARTRTIQELAASSLRSARRTPLSLHLVYDRDAFPAVQQLMRDEQKCCAFLDFKMSDNADGVHLSITAPVEATQAADTLFAHFAPDLAPQKS